MVMNGNFFSTVDDSFYTEIFPSHLLPLLARAFQNNGQQ
jgi:hypothetical protein